MEKEELKARNANNFKHHPPTDEQVKRYQAIRRISEEYANFLIDNCPQSRELSLAITNLEQAQMWANAAIARNE